MKKSVAVIVILFIAVAIKAFGFSVKDIKVVCDNPRDWKISLEEVSSSDGVVIAKLDLKSVKEDVPPVLALKWEMPQKNMFYMWTVNDSQFSILPMWCGWKTSELARGAPFFALIDNSNRSTFGLFVSDCLRHIKYRALAKEQSSLISCGLQFFTGTESPIKEYSTLIRFDLRSKDFCEVVREGVSWIDAENEFSFCNVPSSAFDPLYSTWYNFHQNVNDTVIEKEAAIASKLGMKVLILDDGWQTDDNNGAYAYCGDWEVSKNRFPDFAGHIKKVQEMGMKYLVWYSVPFVGKKSKNFDRFNGKYLYVNDHLHAAVLDPRFPEVRQFLIDTYVKALKEWNLDGFKLDFIDHFNVIDDPAKKENYAGRDIKSIPVAVERLMVDIRKALTAIKSDILIEFRQQYNGPAMRQFGNMFRVGDCPGHPRQNRIQIANMRLACGRAAVHADMIEWNLNESTQDAANRVINAIFGVVQYSVVLGKVPSQHRDMIAKWIKFSQDHREALLMGKFTAHHPECAYPILVGETDSERVVGVYLEDFLVEINDDKTTFIMNATQCDYVNVMHNGKLRRVACPAGDWIRL
jgi:alpha-galactosidase